MLRLWKLTKTLQGAAMANRVTVWWQGEEYDAVRRNGIEAASDAGSVWQLLHDGTPVTSFAAEPGEAPGSVKEKILGWLEANRSRPALDVGRQ
jgi:hypothetical protein